MEGPSSSSHPPSRANTPLPRILRSPRKRTVTPNGALPSYLVTKPSPSPSPVFLPMLLPESSVISNLPIMFGRPPLGAAGASLALPPERPPSYPAVLPSEQRAVIKQADLGDRPGSAFSRILPERCNGTPPLPLPPGIVKPIALSPAAALKHSAPSTSSSSSSAACPVPVKKPALAVPQPPPPPLPRVVVEEAEEDVKNVDTVYGLRNTRANRRYIAQLEALAEEARSVRDGSHPELIKLREQLEEQWQIEQSKFRAVIDREIEQAQFLYEKERDRLLADARANERQVAQEMLNEVEEQIRNIDSELADFDFDESHAHEAAAPPPSVQRKNLRSSKGNPRATYEHFYANGDGNGGGGGAGGGGYGTPVARKKREQFATRCLLTEEAISEDLLALGYVIEKTSRASQFRVQMDVSRLVYEGKSFPRGAVVIVHSEHLGTFAATVTLTSETCVQFKSTMSGDTRTVNASHDDLASGRVLVSKK